MSNTWPFNKVDTNVWVAPDYGRIVKRKGMYWAANDRRTELIGVRNDELCKPVIGPCRTLREAIEQYDAALRNTRSGSAGKGGEGE